MKTKFVIHQGVAGSSKTRTLMQNIRMLIEELTRDRFETGTEPVLVRILTFANCNSEATIKSYLSKIQKISKFDPVFSTLDSFMNQYLRPDYDIEYEKNPTTIADWTAYLEGSKKLSGFLKTSVDYNLHRIFEGLKVLESIHGRKQMEIIFIDESQDIKPRHLIFLLMLIASGRVAEIHVYGDRQQSLDVQSVDLTKGHRRSMSRFSNPEMLYPLVASKLKIEKPIDLEVDEKEPVGLTQRNSIEYIESASRCSNSLLRRVFNGPDTRMVSDHNNPENQIIEVPLSQLPRNAEIRSVILDRNLLKASHDNIAKFQASESLKLSERLRIPLVCIYCKAAIKSLENILKKEDTDAYKMALRDCFSEEGPRTHAGKFLKNQLRDNQSVASGFVDFMCLYFEMVQDVVKTLEKGKKLTEGLSQWIASLKAQDESLLSQKLIEIGLTNTFSWFKLIGMDKDQNAFESLSFGRKFIFAWTVFKAKGQTFGDSTAIIWLPSEIEQSDLKDSRELRDNKIYTMLTRSKNKSYVLSEGISIQ